MWQIPDAVDTIVCAPDDGWKYHPKHVEQFPDKINGVMLHLDGYILEYYYDARTHERLNSEIAYCLINRDSFPVRVRDLQFLRNVQTGARLHPASYSTRPGLSLSGNKTVGARSWPFPPQSTRIGSEYSNISTPSWHAKKRHHYFKHKISNLFNDSVRHMLTRSIISATKP